VHGAPNPVIGGLCHPPPTRLRRLYEESVESVLKKKRKAMWWEGFAEKEGFKPGIKREGVLDNESGESMESTGEVPSAILTTTFFFVTLLNIRRFKKNSLAYSTIHF